MKPCPFCKCEHIVGILSNQTEVKTISLLCTNCGARGPCINLDNLDETIKITEVAMKRWETRP